MRALHGVNERDRLTGLDVGYVPGWPGAHSQGATVDEVTKSLEEVIAMLLDDGVPPLTADFVGTCALRVA